MTATYFLVFIALCWGLGAIAMDIYETQKGMHL